MNKINIVSQIPTQTWLYKIIHNILIVVPLARYKPIKH